MKKINPDKLRREIQDSLRGCGKEFSVDHLELVNRFHKVFFVLKTCRVLQDLHEVRITSKLEGINWAKKLR